MLFCSSICYFYQLQKHQLQHNSMGNNVATGMGREGQDLSEGSVVNRNVTRATGGTSVVAETRCGESCVKQELGRDERNRCHDTIIFIYLII